MSAITVVCASATSTALTVLVMFVVLWWVSSRPRRRGMISGLFLLLYAVFRFSVEFVRRPDPQLGFIAFDWLTMGQLLTVPMALAGIAVPNFVIAPILALVFGVLLAWLPAGGWNGGALPNLVLPVVALVWLMLQRIRKRLH